MGVEAAQGVDGQAGGAGELSEFHGAERLAGAGALAGEDGRDDHRINAKAGGARDGGGAVGGGGFDVMAGAGAGKAGFGPVDAGGSDAGGERGVGGDQQHKAALPADAGEGAACGETVSGAEMPPDDAEAARQAARNAQDIGCSCRIGEMEGAGQRLPVARAGWLCKVRGRKELAADRGLGLSQF